MKDESLANNVISLHSRGWSMRRISREFQISRGRVKGILDKNDYQRQNGQPPKTTASKGRPSKLDPYKTYIQELLEAYKDPPITNQRIFELLEEKGFPGKITILCYYLSKVRGKRTKDPIVCVETLPGQRASHDWSDYYLDFTDKRVGSKKVTFLSYILNYSRRQYIEVVEDKTQTTLLRGLVNAFVYLDGVPQEIKSDNQKACVHRWEYGQPIFNKNYLSFATHYRFRPLTIHPGKPRENLKIERPFYYLETNFLNGRKFRDLSDLKMQLASWLVDRNDQRIHRTTRRKPIDLYAEELAHLQTLPEKQYDTSIISYRIVNNESAIQWENYYYIVPKKYMYETCPVRINQEQIIIYNPDCHQIATYDLAPKGSKNRYVGRKEKSKKYSLPVQQVAERLQAFGPIVQQYIQKIKDQNPTSYQRHWRSILSLKANYRQEDIIRAVKRALTYRIYEVKAIENFLEINAEKKSELLFTSSTQSDGR